MPPPPPFAAIDSKCCSGCGDPTAPAAAAAAAATAALGGESEPPFVGVGASGECARLPMAEMMTAKRAKVALRLFHERERTRSISRALLAKKQHETRKKRRLSTRNLQCAVLHSFCGHRECRANMRRSGCSRRLNNCACRRRTDAFFSRQARARSQLT